jgi:hypothetical protein
VLEIPVGEFDDHIPTTVKNWLKKNHPDVKVEAEQSNDAE